MKAKWIEAKELPENEKVYLKKDFFGWRVVDPYLPGDGWLKAILGGKRNQLFCGIIIILALLFYLGVNELVDNYKAVAQNPCQYCTSCFNGNNIDTKIIPIPNLTSAIRETNSIG